MEITRREFLRDGKDPESMASTVMPRDTAVRTASQHDGFMHDAMIRLSEWRERLVAFPFPSSRGAGVVPGNISRRAVT
jgi:hypothetical protein